jgi:hypothetical protein
VAEGQDPVAVVARGRAVVARVVVAAAPAPGPEVVVAREPVLVVPDVGAEPVALVEEPEPAEELEARAEKACRRENG